MLTLEETTKAQGEKKYSSTVSLTLAIDGVGAQRHAPVTLPPANMPGTHSTGGRVGPRAGLNGCAKSRHQRESIPGPSSP
jgi:hypothetical protein